ncbi:hypothetical protein CSKR_200918 [Clonorchis sinensis]|uniref:Uncharacterized protein n=1 Tax=Clonorchis sinensis TaxID=79923 RepID=A0A8T1MK57_CLOSI|nr:hypothetical protein CSKR_200918 [Clonorchis sinensis]
MSHCNEHATATEQELWCHPNCIYMSYHPRYPLFYVYPFYLDLILHTHTHTPEHDASLYILSPPYLQQISPDRRCFRGHISSYRLFPTARSVVPPFACAVRRGSSPFERLDVTLIVRCF